MADNMYKLKELHNEVKSGISAIYSIGETVTDCGFQDGFVFVMNKLLEINNQIDELLEAIK